MPTPPGMSELQAWMFGVVTHPAGPESVPSGARLAVEDVITASRQQSSAERLAVYANAYYARLMECLGELFPATRSAVGEDAFADMAFGYLQAYPPRSYTLGRLADHFVDYLEQTRQASLPDEVPKARGDEHETGSERASIEGGQSVSPPGLPSLADDGEAEFDAWSRFVVELARFEQAIDDVFDGPGLEGRANALCQQLDACGPEQLAGARLVPAPCLRLLRCEFPVNDYFSAYRRGDGPAAPAPCASFVAVHRRDYRVRRFPLTELQYDLLRALTAGQTIAGAVEGEAVRLEAAGGAAQLRAWFADWAAAEFFVRLETE